MLTQEEILNILAWRFYNIRIEFELEGNKDNDMDKAKNYLAKWIENNIEKDIIGVLEDENNTEI